MSKNTQLYKQLEPIARKAVKCNACFEDDVLRLERPEYVNLAQPRHIGKDYQDDPRRIAFVMINPGEGNKEEDEWQEALKDFRGGKISLEDVLEDEKHRDLPSRWVGGKIEKFIKRHGLELKDIALVNIAWCATKGNAHPSWMLRKCFKRHTYKWLQRLEPNTVILSGQEIEPFKHAFESLFWPQPIKVFTTYHYAHRGRSVANANDQIKEVKRKLKKMKKDLEEQHNV